jgi:hypothetical protein
MCGLVAATTAGTNILSADMANRATRIASWQVMFEAEVTGQVCRRGECAFIQPGLSESQATGLAW